MLNGLEPVIIFQFSKVNSFDVGSDIPVISDLLTFIDEPPIPIYLSDSITGLFIDSEDKNVDIQTDTETKSDASEPDITQKGVSSVVTVNLIAKKGSIGISLLSAMIDSIYSKVTSKEYSISYLHGATTVFRGVLHNFSVNQNANDERLNIKIEISKGSKTPEKSADVVSVTPVTGEVPL